MFLSNKKTGVSAGFFIAESKFPHQFLNMERNNIC